MDFVLKVREAAIRKGFQLRQSINAGQATNGSEYNTFRAAARFGSGASPPGYIRGRFSASLFCYAHCELSVTTFSNAHTHGFTPVGVSEANIELRFRRRRTGNVCPRE